MTPASAERRRTLQALAGLLGLGAACTLPLRVGSSEAASSGNFWRLLRAGGCVVLMRHAQTVPGVGDPPGWQLGQCSTQRNLNETGREQARRVGLAFHRENVRVDEVRASAWCRCTETADLAFGRHTVWAPLNSFFQTSEGTQSIAMLRAALPHWPSPGNLVLVTHQVTMSKLTGAYPAMGELFLVRPSPDSQEPWKVLARHTP